MKFSYLLFLDRSLTREIRLELEKDKPNFDYLSVLCIMRYKINVKQGIVQ